MEHNILILDGGLGRELEGMGAPFRQPEWSALALMESPEHVLKAHENFIDADADIITTNAYAVVPYHIGQERFDIQGIELAALSGQLAKQAVEKSEKDIRIAGCLPPALGSYHPENFDEPIAREIWSRLIKAQEPFVDVWLAETLSRLVEAKLALDLLENTDKPIWLSFTLIDDASSPPKLRSGKTVQEACAALKGTKADAILFNCSQPEVMENAVKITKEILPDIKIGVYANAFPPISDEHLANDQITPLRSEITPEHYAEFAQSWIDAGASIIGGCCGIGPAHIKKLIALRSND